MSDLDTWMVEVTDLKQYRLCKRVVFFRYCLPRVRPLTGKMTLGITRHREEAQREERRSLRAYGVTTGERIFDVMLHSPQLGLVGQIDMVIITADTAYPVEYKLSTREPGPHVRLQLTAYALLVEERWGLPVTTAFSYQLPRRQAVAIPITARQRTEARAAIAAIRAMVTTETMPTPPAKLALCAVCEFRRFCNDVT